MKKKCLVFGTDDRVSFFCQKMECVTALLRYSNVKERTEAILDADMVLCDVNEEVVFSPELLNTVLLSSFFLRPCLVRISGHFSVGKQHEINMRFRQLNGKDEKSLISVVFVSDSPQELWEIEKNQDVDRLFPDFSFLDKKMNCAHLFTARLLWQSEEELVPGRSYRFCTEEDDCIGTFLQVKYQFDEVGSQIFSARGAVLGDSVTVDISLKSTCALIEGKTFFTVKKTDGRVVAKGVVLHVLRRSGNVVWQETDINRKIRSRAKNQMPRTLWFTGLSGSGKSTLANAVEKKLVEMGYHTMLLDGDNVRHGLNRDLGFTEKDRVENIRRTSEVCRLMNDAGLIVLAAFITPYNSDRCSARKIIGSSFVEIHVSTPLSECEKRDVKGLYAKARKGNIPNFTGDRSI